MQLARNGVEVRLWGRDAAAIRAMARRGENHPYLPGCPLGANVHPEASLTAAVTVAADVLVAVPSHALRDCLQALQPLLQPAQRVIWATKGLEPDTALLPDQVAAAVLGTARPVAVLSGPSFAGEVGRGLPSAVTIASRDAAFAHDMAAAFHDGIFRVYTTTDIIGVGVGGAVKNVIAIAVGMADGLGYGANTRALLITRGLSEMMRLGAELGGERATFTGMAGLGDLLLTCSDDQSRNRRMGLALAAGRSVAQAGAEIRQVVEGVRVAPEVARIAADRAVDMPITTQVCRVLHDGRTPAAAANELAGRPSRPEQD